MKLFGIEFNIPAISYLWDPTPPLGFLRKKDHLFRFVTGINSRKAIIPNNLGVVFVTIYSNWLSVLLLLF